MSYFSDVDVLCEEKPDVVLLCTSVTSTEKVLRSLPLHRLKSTTLFVDVLSVKRIIYLLFMKSSGLQVMNQAYGAVTGF